MKKTLQLIVVFITTLTLHAQQIGEQVTSGSMTYTITNDNPLEVECNGFTDPTADAVANVVIPQTITPIPEVPELEFTVAGIGNGAFSGNEAANKGAGNVSNKIIESITLPTTVIAIGEHAFRDLNLLTAINLENVQTTGSNCFNGATALTEVDFSSLVTFGRYTFVGNDQITSLELPSSLTTIETGAMFDMDGIGAINIPSSVTTIDDNFLRRCDALSSVQLNWTDLSTVTFNSTNYLGDLTPTNITLYVPTGKKSDYESSAFNLSGVTIVEGVLPTTFLGQVFTDQGISYQVTSLSPNEVAVQGATVANVVIGTTATNGTDVFDVTSIAAGSFQGNTVIETVDLPSTITEIGANTFRSCPNLTSLDTEHIQVIGGNILRQSPNVTTLDLGSVTTLESNALGRAYGLTGVLDLPNIQTVGPYAFVYAQGVTEIKFGSSLASIDGNTFYGLPSLQTVWVEATTPPTATADFVNGNTSDRAEDTLPSPNLGNVVLKVPTGTVTTYEAALGWQVFGTTETLSVDDILKGTLKVNITSDAITVNSSSTFTSGNLSVYDITGRLLVSKTLNSASATVNISSLSSGIYIVKVSENGAELVKRFAK